MKDCIRRQGCLQGSSAPGSRAIGCWGQVSQPRTSRHACQELGCLGIILRQLVPVVHLVGRGRRVAGRGVRQLPAQIGHLHACTLESHMSLCL